VTSSGATRAARDAEAEAAAGPAGAAVDACRPSPAPPTAAVIATRSFWKRAQGKFWPGHAVAFASLWRTTRSDEMS